MYILLRKIEICDIKYYNVKIIIKITHRIREKMKRFFYQKEIEIIEEYESFNIVLIKEINTRQEYYIDKELLSYEPLTEKSINISYINLGNTKC